MAIRNNKPNKISILLEVEGMKCGGCLNTVERTLLEQTNVENASVNLVERTALLELKNADEGIEDILDALANRGFPSKKRIRTEANSPSELIQRKQWWEQWNQLMVSLFLLLLSVIGHLAEGGKIDLPIIGTLPFHACLATYALFGPGLEILKSGLRSAINFSPTMDTLVGIGVFSAYLASLAALIWPNVGWPCFFNEPVMLLGFVLLGRFLEERARYRTGRALQELAQLQPDTARLFINNNETKEVRVGALQIGEKVEVLAGDRIPIDGIILSGNSSIDISSLTGEPLPVLGKTGVEVSAGSLNLDGTILVQVNRIGAETSLARVIGLVEQAQARKAPIQRLADIVAGKFCYGVVALSISTFFFWWKVGTDLWPEVLNNQGQGLINHQAHALHSSLGSQAQTPLGLAIQLSIAVLVVACPCALGLATPTVISVASGKAAKKGWLFKGGDVIEKAASINQIIFDKTGTLTVGRPVVTDYLSSKDNQYLIQIAASLENNSRHPIAYAILQEAQRREISLIKSLNVKNIPGKGIYGNLENINGKVMAGTIEWSKSEGVKFEDDLYVNLKKTKYVGKSFVIISIEKKLIGVIIIDDQIRNDAVNAIQKLKNLGHKIRIMSGDRKESVIRIGEEIGLSSNEVSWQLLPEDKLISLEKLKENNKTAMVGDGINDAPALATSDLGIAIGTGTQIAQDSSDIILLSENLESLPEVFLLAKRTIKKIKQNLIWAFGYNLIALPIAAGILLPQFNVLLSPPIAALLMAVSSITVVMNALSLRTS